MATTIKLKNSVTTTNAPSSLVQGEVAINITDKKVWVGNAATTPIQLLGDGGSASFTSIAFGAGTVSSPSITFTGDTNTGIYSPAADTIAFTEGGVESMRINSSGNVGIGVTSPSVVLQVFSAASGIIQIKGGSSTNQGGAFSVQLAGSTNTLTALGDRARLFGGTPDQIASIYTGSSIPLTFDVNNSERMRIDSSGNVGIGTSAPDTKLSVLGNSVRFTQSTYSSGTTGSGILIDYASGYSRISSYINGFANWGNLILQESGGNVGIGTSSPASRLNVAGGNITVSAGNGIAWSGDQTRIFTPEDNVSGGLLQWGSSGILRFNSGTTERMRIDTSGNVGIGTSSPTNYGAGTTTLSISNSSGSGYFDLYNAGSRRGYHYATASTYNISTTTSTALVFETVGTERMRIDSSGTLCIGTTSNLSSAFKTNIENGRLGVSASSDQYALYLRYNTSTLGFYLGSPSADALAFSNSAGSERMRITAGGALYVGCTAVPGAGTTVVGSALDPNGYISTYRTNGTSAYFARSNDGEVMALYSGATQRGTVSISGATTTYGSVSDYRLKENIVLIDNALSVISKLKPASYNFKEFPNTVNHGFIAHELQGHIPEAVTGQKDAIKEDGNPDYQFVDMAKIVPFLTKAIQEQQAMIEELKQEVAKLKGV